ncbi:MAG: PilZ domain-containing protein [Spirochaetales bacterium]|uniref:PilZ domain-containing protein n=1 Tax=Candidatus Thalassospirochaeta sargassi TaxID=3119039 RepID=A0AAJ1MJB6_9SPIO|nr:PilZ domain-containing protein [Spirochaetales bacterium]
MKRVKGIPDLDIATVESSVEVEKNEPLIKAIKRKRYINAINYANFICEPLNIVFQHKIFARSISLQATPSPCTKETLELEWLDGSSEEALEQFECTKILIPDGELILSVSPTEYNLTPNGMNLTLPLSGEILNYRKAERFPAENINAVMTQNGCFYEGELINFNSDSFLVSLYEKDNPELRWLNPDDQFHMMLKKEDGTIFTGGCSLLSTREYDDAVLHVFKVLNSKIQRFKKKKYRAERYELQSPVQISFVHPLSGERCRIQAIDISASGLRLTENSSHSVLIPGLIIPEMELSLPGGSPLKCRTQVIYRDKEESRNDEYRYGMALLDMDPAHHSTLLNFIHQTNDSNSSVCAPVDTAALWRFFFESGFIYPEKYKHLANSKERMKDIYERLYTRSPGIARHFIYHEGHRIEGHMSMLRSYENSWLLHHHAATSINNKNAGLHVLNQVGSFSNSSHRIRSMHMLYLMCYYREENRFPRRVFGDIAKNADNKNQLSLDSWAYFFCTRSDTRPAGLYDGWTLDETTSSDLKNLESFYQKESGGLMLKAMNLTNGGGSNNNLLKSYESAGFNRDIKLFSLNHNGECKSIIMADQSETGLNLSNLTNSIKVFIISLSDLTYDIIQSFIYEVSVLFKNDNRVPVLMYPEYSAEKLGIQKEKNYTLWILNTEAGDAYFKHLKTLLKTINH